MEANRSLKPGLGLRIRAGILFILALAVAIWLATGLISNRNPWIIHKADAAGIDDAWIMNIAESASPYVKITGMDLSFTGFYMASDDSEDQEVYSYCYKGRIGSDFLIVNLPAEDGGKLASQTENGDTMLTEMTIIGQLKPEDTMTAYLSKAEEMGTSEYREYYHVVACELDAYDNDNERIRIYNLMMLVFIVGTVAAGVVLMSESFIKDKDTNEEGD